MNEINKINLSEQTKFRLSEIIGIGNYFLFIIFFMTNYLLFNQRKSCSKQLNKYLPLLIT